MGDLKQFVAKARAFSEAAQEIAKFAEMIKNVRGFVPDNFIGKPAEITAVILRGMEYGIPPMAALNSFFILNGRVGMYYDAMVGVLRDNGYSLKWKESTQEKAVLILEAKNGDKAEFCYTKKDAQTAGLLNKQNWKAHPASMLRARCVTSSKAFTGILAGIYSRDEIEEMTYTSRTNFVDGKTTEDTLLSLISEANQEEQTEESTPQMIEHQDSEEFVDIKCKLELSLNQKELLSVGEMIKNSDSISEDEKKALRSFYQTRRNELAPREHPNA